MTKLSMILLSAGYFAVTPAMANKEWLTTGVHTLLNCSNTEEGVLGTVRVGTAELGKLSKEISLKKADKELHYKVRIDDLDFDADGKPDVLTFTLVTKAMGGKIDLGGVRSPSVGIAGGDSDYVDAEGEGFTFEVNEVKATLSSKKNGTAYATGFSRYSLYRMSEDAEVKVGVKQGGKELSPEEGRGVRGFKAVKSLFIEHEGGSFRLGKIGVTLVVRVKP